jgi:glycosyltransferase involved in cell wall biosynthesis
MGSDVGLAAYADGAPQGLPNKVIEYLAASLPVVSSLKGETLSLLADEDCGLSYIAGDGIGLRAALLLLGEPEYRERLSRRARAVFERDFQAEYVYSQFASYLEALAR